MKSCDLSAYVEPQQTRIPDQFIYFKISLSFMKSCDFYESYDFYEKLLLLRKVVTFTKVVILWTIVTFMKSCDFYEKSLILWMVVTFLITHNKDLFTLPLVVYKFRDLPSLKITNIWTTSSVSAQLNIHILCSC